MNEERIRAAAQMIQNAAHDMGTAYQQLVEELDVCRREVMKEGGIHSVEDLMGHASPDRLRHDIIALLIAVGFGDVFVQAAGRRDWTPQPDLLGRYQGLIASGVLTANRGKQNTDPLSAYAHPGVKIVSPAPQATSPQGQSI